MKCPLCLRALSPTHYVSLRFNSIQCLDAHFVYNWIHFWGPISAIRLRCEHIVRGKVAVAVTATATAAMTVAIVNDNKTDTPIYNMRINSIAIRSPTIELYEYFSFNAFVCLFVYLFVRIIRTHVHAAHTRSLKSLFCSLSFSSAWHPSKTVMNIIIIHSSSSWFSTARMCFFGFLSVCVCAVCINYVHTIEQASLMLLMCVASTWSSSSSSS